ncbi:MULTISPECIES: alpha/beta fold hydrolase [Clostridia]|uniref:alpha/beta fold hydrolase n=1 Tax=Clostridia TaxID=186801 RepID=UPI0018AC5F37|nr:alpha/beta fold hydrolase [Clostridium sp. 1001270J_160509_D11]
MTKKKSYLKKIVICLLTLILVCSAGFYIYASDYYHAKDYEVSNVDIKQQDNYTVYGDTNSKTGFIFYPGGKVEAKSYEPILTSLSEKGICVVLVEMPFNLAVLNSNAADKVMSKFNNIENWYIGGHSLGGAMAASYAAKHQDNLKSVVLLAAYPTKELDIPVLSIYGSEDGVLNREKYKDSIGMAKNLSEIIIDGGNHAQFGNYGEQSGDNKSKISSEKQWNQTTNEILNFIK